jgi:hypothetical protein
MHDGPSIKWPKSSLAASLRWVTWRNEPRGGKLTKVPYSPGTGCKAKADTPATWSTRVAAEQAVPRLVNGTGGGIGLQLGDIGRGVSIGGVDLDTCRDGDGAFAPWAIDVMELFQSYAEVSPSGTGAKIFFAYPTADLSQLRSAMGTDHGKSWKRGGGDHPAAIELHIGHRYFTLTGQRIPEHPADLAMVPTNLIVRLIQIHGPAFVKGGEATSSARPKASNDGSRSAL